MSGNSGSYRGLAAILGGLVLLAAAMFIVTGGDFGGTKRVEGDHDLPKVTSPRVPASDMNTGSR
jgi:hypothetical protein